MLEQVIDLKVNPLLQIMAGDREVLVPLLKDTVTKVDRNSKELHVQSPEGLIDLYLS